MVVTKIWPLPGASYVLAEWEGRNARGEFVTLRCKRGVAELSKTIQAAWVRFPELDVVKAAQTYTRLDELTYRYASGTFEAELTVDDDGLVTSYAEWRRTGFALGPEGTEPLDGR